MNTRELAKEHPEAFAALPECYQSDDCLFFWEGPGALEEQGGLYCCPAIGQHEALGRWEAGYNSIRREWIVVYAEGLPQKGCKCHAK